MCTHWNNDDFKKKSEQTKKNRGQLRVVHSTDSRSFEEVKLDMRASLGRPPTMLEFWDRAHTPKESSMSPASLVIRNRFQNLRDQCVVELRDARGVSKPLDSTIPLLEIELSRDEELRLWVASQDPPTSSTCRYRVLGLPRIPAYALLGRSSQRQRLRALVGPSHTGAGLDDEIFQMVMAAVSETFRTDPIIRRQELPSRARLHQLAQDIAAGATVESTGIPQEQFVAIRDKVLRLVVTLLSEALGPIGSQPPPTRGGDPDIVGDGEQGDDEDEDLQTPEQLRRPPPDDSPTGSGT